ncbi:uracil-DNA glycosylase, family 4 [Pyrobaculum sp. WP30]|nr:uracil-DNA glycosylase, family 4 [Pyrobaculum sp. WP30]
MDLEELSREILTCVKCPLHMYRTSAVPGEGSVKLGIMIVGEAPGADEDRTGRPFVGAAGRLLTEALARLGVSRDDVYITNVVKCRPPNNRTPTREEVEACLPYLLRQIELLRPRRIVALGLTSAKTLLSLVGKRVEKIGDVRRRCFRGRVAGVEVEICATYHPAAVLRNPRLKEEFMGDLAAFLGGGLERFF